LYTIPGVRGEEMSKIRTAFRATKLAITKRLRGLKRLLLKKRRLQDL
jgi:hypothetical protein